MCSSWNLLLWYGDAFFWNLPYTPPYELLKSALHRPMSWAQSLATRGLSNGRLTLASNQHRCRVLVLQQPMRARQCGLSHIFRLQNQWVFYITTGRSCWGHSEVSTCILHSREQEGRKEKKKKNKTKSIRPLRGKGIDLSLSSKCLHLTSTNDLLKQTCVRETGKGGPPPDIRCSLCGFEGGIQEMRVGWFWIRRHLHLHQSGFDHRLSCYLNRDPHVEYIRVCALICQPRGSVCQRGGY
jgi:hypothetical protein